MILQCCIGYFLINILYVLSDKEFFMDIDYKAIGVRVRLARKKKNYTQERLAEIVSLAPNHISNIETGSTKLSLPAIISIASALDTNVDSLLYDNIPVLVKAYDADVKNILDDCSSKERAFLLHLMKETKTALRNNKLK